MIFSAEIFEQIVGQVQLVGAQIIVHYPTQRKTLLTRLTENGRYKYNVLVSGWKQVQVEIPTVDYRHITAIFFLQYNVKI